MEGDAMPTIRMLIAVLAVVSALGLVACGGGPETVTDETVVTEQQVETEVETDVETDVETVDDDSGGSGEDDSGGDDDDAGDCPPGEVLSAPGNKCRPADDSGTGG
jgi:hypothetical protein